MSKPTLQDLCRDAKARLGMTSQELSDRSGVPISTINNFFAATSKAPPVYTAGPICAALGVDLNGYFGIEPHATPEELRDLTERVHSAELEAVRLRGLAEKQEAIIDTQAAAIRLQKRNSTASTIISIAAIIFLLVDRLVLDHAVPLEGVIINGEFTAGAWLLIGGVTLVGVVLAKLLWDTAMRNTPKIDEGADK